MRKSGREEIYLIEAKGYKAWNAMALGQSWKTTVCP
jgi:hypothetical protein